MTIIQMYTNLKQALEEAESQFEQAKEVVEDLKKRFDFIYDIDSKIFPISDIESINPDEQTHTLIRHYNMDGKKVMFNIVKTDALVCVGQIIDYLEKTILYACEFYYDDSDTHEHLFHCLLSRYIEGIFDF